MLFKDLDIIKPILRAVEEAGYEKPTEIQENSIPVVLKGKDILGNLNWGLTVLKPVYSHNECNMTKGHFHVNKDCAEIYFGIAGVGLLLLMDEEGHTWAEKVYEGSLHHIDGRIAHRLVNTGDEDLKVGACWPTSAGHDYHAIEKREFGYRVYKRNGQIEFEKR